MSKDKEHTNKQATEVRPGQLPDFDNAEAKARLRVSRETVMTLAAWQANRTFVRAEQMADDIALAILRNPKVDQLLGRNPLDPGKAGDHANAGAALAHASLRLADDYVQALDDLLKVRAQRLPRGSFGLDENGDTDRPA